MATWDEIDLDKAIWKIPAIRMKNAKEHAVPLSSQAIEVLTYVRSRCDARQNAVFPSERLGQFMGSGVLSRLVRRLDIPAVPHGLRSSFKDWSAESEIDDDLSEVVLSHMPKGRVKQSYLRTRLFDLRVPVMQEWANFLTDTMGAVVLDTSDRR